jgi:hypothetical protein
MARCCWVGLDLLRRQTADPPPPLRWLIITCTGSRNTNAQGTWQEAEEEEEEEEEAEEAEEDKDKDK